MRTLQQARVRPLDRGAAILGLVVVASVYSDGWAHLNIGGLDTFFSPWHAALYGSFTALAVLLGTATMVARLRGARWGRAVPAGYAAGIAGVAVFAAGGVLDMLWHVAFGIEVGIDALVSPTHLLLLVGGVLLLSSPFRSVSRRSEPRIALAWPAVLSMTAVTALGGFFLSYVSVFVDPAARLALTSIPEGAPGHNEAEIPAAAGLAAYLVTTALLVVSALWLRGHGRLGPGALPALVAGAAFGGAALTRFEFLWPAVGAVAGAAVADSALRWSERRWGPGQDLSRMGALLPAGVWSGQLVGLAAAGLLAWPVQMWLGTIALATLGGLAVGLVAARTPGEGDAVDSPFEPALP